jgi:hypothetical protein
MQEAWTERVWLVIIIALQFCNYAAEKAVPIAAFYDNDGNPVTINAIGSEVEVVSSQNSRMAGSIRLEGPANEPVVWLLAKGVTLVGISKTGRVAYWSPLNGRRLGSVDLSRHTVVEGKIPLAAGAYGTVSEDSFAIENLSIDSDGEVLWLSTATRLYEIGRHGSKVSVFQYTNHDGKNDKVTPLFFRIFIPSSILYAKFENGQSKIYSTRIKQLAPEHIGTIEGDIVDACEDVEHWYFTTATLGRSLHSGPRLAGASNYIISIIRKGTFTIVKRDPINGIPIRSFLIGKNFYSVARWKDQGDKMQWTVSNYTANSATTRKNLDDEPRWGQFLNEFLSSGTPDVYQSKIIYVNRQQELKIMSLP